jgi:hypothetical protein
MVKGFTPAQMGLLLRLNSESFPPEVYIYDSAIRTAFTAPKDFLTWPVLYVLSHHPKHIFKNKKQVSLSQISESLEQFDRKIRWNLYFQRCPNEDEWKHLSIKKPAEPCTINFGTEFESTMAQFKLDFFKEVKRANSRFSGKRHLLANQNPVVTLGLKIIAGSQYAVVKSDKDGGFVLLAKTDLAFELQRLVNDRSRYQPVNGSLDTLALETADEFNRIVAEAVDSLGLDFQKRRALMVKLLSPWRLRAQYLAARLKATVKTHKDPGNVSFRALHAQVSSPYESTMRFLVLLMKPIIRTIPHLMHSSAQVVKAISALHVPHDAYFLKIDIKEYFMEGVHSDLIKHTIKYIEPISWRGAYRALLEHILFHQYVVHRSHLYRVSKGSGMGLIHSSDLLDLAFFGMVEDGFINNVNVQRRLGILWYGRYRDDILIVGSGSFSQRARLVEILRIKSVIWKLEVEQISFSQVSYLDLLISKGPRFFATNLLDTEVYHKPSSLKRPLHYSSYHAFDCHTSWPRAMLQRASSLCNTASGMKREREHLHNFLRSYFEQEYLDLLFEPKELTQKRPSRTTDITKYLILPFMREFEFVSMRSILRRLAEDLGRIRFFQSRRDYCGRITDTHYEFLFSFGIGYKNSGPHLETKLWNLAKCHSSSYGALIH